jgi:predicted metal-dependent phosphoesterase TrpH
MTPHTETKRDAVPRACDLHMHTFYSDGTLSPTELVRAAHKVGLTHISLTDHDITDGIDEAAEEGKKLGVEVVAGVELSAMVRNANGVESEMHILGYFLNYRNAHFQETLGMFRKTRLKRAEHMIVKLGHLGLKLSPDKIRDHANGKAVGRPHIARALLEAGYVASFEEAFHKYLKEGRPAYVPKALLTPVECVQLIRRVGGLAVVAHPQFGGPRQKKGWESLVRAGLNGIEAYHSQQPPGQAKSYERIAQEFGLLVTGGSDFHSFENGPKGALGDVRLPYSCLEALRTHKDSHEKRTADILQHAH